MRLGWLRGNRCRKSAVKNRVAVKCRQYLDKKNVKCEKEKEKTKVVAVILMATEARTLAYYLSH